jgi:outer membrane protein with beta-barrel domain
MSPTPAIARLVLASILVFASAPAAADPPSYGLKAGLGIATVHGNLPTDPFLAHGTRRGFGGGAAFTFGLGGALALQPEILFVTKGTSLGQANVTDWNGTVIGTTEVIQACNYVEIPVLIRVATPTAGALSPFLLAGPVIGVLASQKIVQQGMDGGWFPLDVARGTDVGITLGFGAEFGRGRARGTIESRYTLGVTPATDASYSDARNSSLLVMAGVAIHP